MPHSLVDIREITHLKIALIRFCHAITYINLSIASQIDN